METLIDQDMLKEEIFEREFLPHSVALYSYAYHNLTNNEEDAGDLLQETLLRAFRFIDRYDTGTNAKAWLFKIMKNIYINQYRSKKKGLQRVDFEEGSNFHQEDDNSPFSGYQDLREEIFGSIMGDEVTAALEKLSPNKREVIVLCEIEGFSYKEIAEITGTELNTVRTRLHRGRNDLKGFLKEYAASQGFKDSESDQ